MSIDEQMRSAPGAAAPAHSYDRVLKTIHWTSLLLIAAAYTAVWASHAVAGREHAMLVQLHRSLGLTVFALTLFRLGWRCRARIPELPLDLPRLQRAAARTTERLIYLLLALQPMLGVLDTNARGRRIDFYFLGELPAIIGRNKLLGSGAAAAHQFVGYLFLGVIALHAAAALFHHFIRRDDVLRAMLPGACTSTPGVLNDKH